MNRNRIATHSDATLDVILRTIGVMHNMRLAFFGRMVPIVIAQHERVEQVRIALGIVIRIFRLARVAENNDITMFRFGISRELLVRERNRGTVGKLEAEQEISRLERIFHGSTRNLERLDDVLDNDQSKDNRDNNFASKRFQKLFS